MRNSHSYRFVIIEKLHYTPLDLLTLTFSLDLNISLVCQDLELTRSGGPATVFWNSLCLFYMLTQSHKGHDVHLNVKLWEDRVQ